MSGSPRNSDPGGTFAFLLLAAFTLAILVLLVLSILHKQGIIELFLPVSGSEPEYTPEAWNKNPVLKKNHNCYAYVLDDLVHGRKNKPQPGTWSNIIDPGERVQKYNSCPEMLGRIMADNASIYQIEESEPCEKGYYKGYLVLDPGKDYHFYRQDSNGYFSHKRGKLDVENVDSVQNRIEVPRLAAKNYGGYNYTESCGYFCIPNNKTRKTNSV